MPRRRRRWPTGSRPGASGRGRSSSGSTGPPGRASPTRLDAGNAARASKALGLRAGLARGTNPHGLRHQGITRALDLAHGDVRKVKRFSRHAKLETLLRYDDNRRDEAGAIAKLLGEDSE